MFRTVTIHPQELLFTCCMCKLWYVLIRPVPPQTLYQRDLSAHTIVCTYSIYKESVQLHCVSRWNVYIFSVTVALKIWTNIFFCGNLKQHKGSHTKHTGSKTFSPISFSNAQLERHELCNFGSRSITNTKGIRRVLLCKLCLQHRIRLLSIPARYSCFMTIHSNRPLV